MVRSKIFENSVKILASAIIGTSAMTLYSYLRSGSGNKNFREPQLLKILLENLSFDVPSPSAAGWIMHYKVGFGFAAAYHTIWNKAFRPSILSGALFGAGGGLIGIAIWNTVLRKHPNPPTIDRKAFYQHLILAHLVFGLFAEVGNQTATQNGIKNRQITNVK